MPDDLPKLTFSEGTLVLGGVSRERMAEVFDPGAWVWDRRVGAWRCDAIEYAALGERLARAHLPCEDRVPAWHAVSPRCQACMIPRSWSM